MRLFKGIGYSGPNSQIAKKFINFSKQMVYTKSGIYKTNLALLKALCYDERM